MKTTVTITAAGLLQPPPAPDDRATEFKAIEGEGAGEHFSGFTLMVEAYAAIWLIMMVWLALIWRKQADITARVDGLEASLARAERRVVGKVVSSKTEKTDDSTTTSKRESEKESSA